MNPVQIPRYSWKEIDLHHGSNISCRKKRIRQVFTNDRRDLYGDFGLEVPFSGPLLSGTPHPIEGQCYKADQDGEENPSPISLRFFPWNSNPWNSEMLIVAHVPCSQEAK
jgi:hypothetical protein